VFIPVSADSEIIVHSKQKGKNCMKQNTFQTLTATFIGSVIQTLPSNISSRHMQVWIEDPKGLQEMLKDMFEQKIIVIDELDKQCEGRLAFKILKDSDEPFHKQTAKFIAVVAQSIPEISNDRMEFWSKHLNTLQRELRSTLIQAVVFV
jgi:hypothetical protein